MTTSEILERAECARDTKARRVSNVAPGTVANITAETLESGVELEALESLNVPVFRYGTQITIHGKLPDFNEAARPGGYRAVFRNANGSVGVRYAAIDGAKKRQIQEVARAAGKGAWSVHANSASFELVAMVSPSLERAAAVMEAKRLFALIPTDRFFGSAYYARGMFGEIFVVANIGALYAENVWPLCAIFFGIGSAEQLEAAKAVQAQEQAERDAAWKIESAQRDAENAARKAQLRATICAGKTPLTVVPDNGTIIVDSDFILTVKLETQRGRLYYTITHRDGQTSYGERKLAKKGKDSIWPKSLAAGRVFAP